MFHVELSRSDLRNGRWFSVWCGADPKEAAECLREWVKLIPSLTGKFDREYRLVYKETK